MLTVEHITKSFGRKTVLAGISFTCMENEAVCIAGMNATGKTTLLSILAGMLHADQGHFQAHGKVGYVPQFSTMLPALTVREQLSLWYAANNLSGAHMFSESSVEARLGLAAYAKYRIEKLSGGLQKRVMIACAMAGKPDVLLLDEPFTALDLQSRADIISEIKRFKEQGKAVVFTSHDPSAIAELADRVLLLGNGKILKEHTMQGDITKRTIQTVSFIANVQ